MAKLADEGGTPGPTGLILHAAARYDAIVWLLTLGRERRFREKMLHLAHLQPGETVLDVGCGTGTLAILAKRLVGPEGTVYGIDASPEMIARAGRKTQQAGVEVTFQEGMAQELPFDDGQVDAVLSTLMLHHLPNKARQQFAKEIQRVLKPNGRVLAVDFGNAPSAGGDLIDRFHRRHGHINVHDIVAVLRQAGLNIVESGAVRPRNLQYVLATPSSRDVAEITSPSSHNAHAAGRAWKRPLTIAAGFAAVAALVALHIGAAVSLFGAGFADLAHPISSAMIGLVLLLLTLKIGLLGGLHRQNPNRSHVPPITTAMPRLRTGYKTR